MITCSRTVLKMSQSMLLQRSFSVISCSVNIPRREPPSRCFSTSQKNVLTQLKGFSSPSSKFQEAVMKSLENARSQKLKDSKGRLIIYKGLMNKKLKLMKQLSIVSSLTVMAYQVVVVLDESMSNTVKMTTATVGLLLALAPLAGLHSLSGTYVTDMLYEEDSDRYIAVKHNLLGVRKEIPFQLSNVKLPATKPTGLRPTTIFVEINGKPIPLHFEKDTFVYPEHYDRLLRSKRTPHLT